MSGSRSSLIEKYGNSLNSQDSITLPANNHQGNIGKDEINNGSQEIGSKGNKLTNDQPPGINCNPTSIDTLKGLSFAFFRCIYVLRIDYNLLRFYSDINIKLCRIQTTPTKWTTPSFDWYTCGMDWERQYGYRWQIEKRHSRCNTQWIKHLSKKYLWNYTTNYAIHPGIPLWQ